MIKRNILFKFLIIFSITVFGFSRPRNVLITLDNALNSSVAKVIFYDSIEYSHEGSIETQDVNPGIFDYTFYNNGNSFKIGLKYKDSTEYISESLACKSNFDKVILSKDHKEIKIEHFGENKKGYQLKTIIVFLLIIILAKVLPVLLIIYPKRRTKFFFEFLGIQVIYYACYILLALFLKDGFPSIIIFVWVLITFFDFIILKAKFDEERGIARIIIASLVGNILFVITSFFSMIFLLFF